MTGPSGVCLLAPVRHDRADWTAAVELDVQPYRPAPSEPVVELTARQRQILDFIAGYTTAHGYPPSFREIADGIGLSSPNSVKYQVDGLRRLGVLDAGSGERRARTLRLLPGGVA